MTRKCDATIVLADDFGERDCTFHCDLPEGHGIKHKVSGTIDGKEYILVWKGYEREE